MKKTKRVAYESLNLIPFIVAESVCMREYKGQDLSEGARSHSLILILESKRKKMTEKEIFDFSSKCDDRCEVAYDAKSMWFEDCVQAIGSNGRDQLYVWMTHWMVSYLINPAKFLSQD